MNYRSRIATSRLPELAALINRAYRGRDGAGRWTSEADLVAGDRINTASLSRSLNSPDGQFLFAFDNDDALCACLYAQTLPEGVEFGTFAVATHLHGKGIGAALLSYAENHLRTQARFYQVEVVAPNTALIEFYRRRGYQHTGERHAYPLEKDVGQPFDETLELVALRKIVRG